LPPENVFYFRTAFAFKSLHIKVISTQNQGIKVKLNCPYCNRKYDLGKTPLGGKVRCFGCNNSFILPNSISIFKREVPSAEKSKPVVAPVPAPQLQSTPRDVKLLGKIISEFFTIGCLLIAFLLASVAVICIFYKAPFQIGIILALAACVIILMPILINLRAINRKLKK
jgi:hypothetical protein